MRKKAKRGRIWWVSWYATKHTVGHCTGWRCSDYAMTICQQLEAPTKKDARAWIERRAGFIGHRFCEEQTSPEVGDRFAGIKTIRVRTKTKRKATK